MKKNLQKNISKKKKEEKKDEILTEELCELHIQKQYEAENKDDKCIYNLVNYSKENKSNKKMRIILLNRNLKYYQDIQFEMREKKLL